MLMNSVLMFAILIVIFYAIPNNRWWPLLRVAQSIPIFTLVPRFMLNLRELYARDLRGRRGSEIDTAFGLTLASTHCAVTSANMFPDAGQNEGEEIQIEEREIRNAGSLGV